LEFNKEFIFRTSVYGFDTVVAITSAYLTKSAVSLVYGLAAAGIAEVIFSFYFVNPKPKLNFELAKLKKVFKRGKWLTLAGFFNYLFTQGDDIVVGRVLNSSALGLYQVPYKISTLPIQEVGEVLNNVTFPVYTRIQGDRKRLKKAFFKILLATSLLVVPFGLILIMFPSQIISIFLGDKWLEATKVLQVLALFGIIRSLTGSGYPVYLSVKKQEYATAVTLVSILGMGTTIIPLVKQYGILGAGYSALIGSFAAIPVVIYYLIKIFRGK
jgi:O-antigen/teichoic acid export membrane protein